MPDLSQVSSKRSLVGGSTRVSSNPSSLRDEPLPPAQFLRHKSELRKKHAQVRAVERRSKISERDAVASSRRLASPKSSGQKSKYAKSSVLLLKEVFDSYDKNGDGEIQRSELETALRQIKEQAQRYDGRSRSLQERQQAVGYVSGRHLDQSNNAENVFLVDCTNAMFNVLDENENGSVSFAELLRICFPAANEADMKAMLQYVNPPPEAEAETPTLSEETRKQIVALFRLYDKDRSGKVCFSELNAAVAACGLDTNELYALMAEHDVDGDGQLDENEFVALMESTGAFGEAPSAFVDDRHIKGLVKK